MYQKNKTKKIRIICWVFASCHISCLWYIPIIWQRVAPDMSLLKNIVSWKRYNNSTGYLGPFFFMRHVKCHDREFGTRVSLCTLWRLRKQRKNQQCFTDSVFQFCTLRWGFDIWHRLSYMLRPDIVFIVLRKIYYCNWWRRLWRIVGLILSSFQGHSGVGGRPSLAVLHKNRQKAVQFSCSWIEWNALPLLLHVTHLGEMFTRARSNAHTPPTP